MKGAGSVELEEGGRLIYSGGDAHMHGVGVALSKSVARSLTGYFTISERLLLATVKGRPFDICLIQVYGPTSQYEVDVVEDFYRDVMKAKEQWKPHDITLVMGDMNAKLVNMRVEDIIGPFGLGERNERGDRLADWCVEN